MKLKTTNTLPRSQSSLFRLQRLPLTTGLWLLLCAMLPVSPLAAQESTLPTKTADASPAQVVELSQSVQELRRQVDELRDSLRSVLAEAQSAHAELAAMRSELAAMKDESDSAAGQTAAGTPAEPALATSSGAVTTESSRIGKLKEEFEFLSGTVNEQHQTKVESASRYRIKLSGIVLLNLFGNQGVGDSLDVPTAALARDPAAAANGSFGATLRQSQFGLEVFGPTLAGARTRADVVVDFAGGFPIAPNGVNQGLVRLRTGTMRLDWKKTSVVAGQDGLFFAPQTPTSFASLAVPALSYAGNLWSWVPQVRVEHRFATGESSGFVVQGGILDNLTGEAPTYGVYRSAHAGELSRQPAYAGRAAWFGTLAGRASSVGVGTYYSRQNYSYGRLLNGWAVTGDWLVPLGSRVTLTGAAYRGRGIGGLGAAYGRSVLFSGDPNIEATAIRGLNAVGGWSQLKFAATARLEFNAALGQDSSFARDLRFFQHPQTYYASPSINANRSAFVNVIFRPRSDLLFSTEYRALRTFSIDAGHENTGQVNVSMGVLF